MKKIILIYPNNDKADYKPSKVYEPTNLLGIYNILKKKYDCLFIDAIKERYTSSDINQIINKFKPDYLMFCVYDVEEIIIFENSIIDYTRSILPECKIIIGGPGAIHSMNKIIDRLSPDYLINGEGEDYYINFTDSDNLDCMESENINNTKVIKPKLWSNFDDIDYERDYSFDKYDMMAMPNIQRGCKGLCIYCTGCGYTKIRYRSPKSVVEEIKYLEEVHGVKCIMPLGPDFTVVPNKALDIIKEINKSGLKNLKYIFVCRLDTLYECLLLDEKEWILFFNNNNVSFQIGIESFQKDKLIRLGKYFKENYYSNNQYNIVDELLNKYNMSINGYFILIDPLSTLEEINSDIDFIINLLHKYPTKFIITGKIINYLELYEDTVAKEMYCNLKYDSFIDNLIKISDEINESNLYSKKLLNSNEDYYDRSLEQIQILNNFKKRCNKCYIKEYIKK